MYYSLSIENSSEEFYSLTEMRDKFRGDRDLYEMLVKEEYLFCIKVNSASRVHYFVEPLGNGEIQLVKDFKESMSHGGYGA
jgi:hypothetical protein